LVKDFLAKNNLTALEHAAYYPDLISANIYLFPKELFDTTDIIKNTMEELKRFSQNDFQECFQHLHSRWKKCTVS
jgi:NDP-sugar pyrophosphorylase family protein